MNRLWSMCTATKCLIHVFYTNYECCVIHNEQLKAWHLEYARDISFQPSCLNRHWQGRGMRTKNGNSATDYYNNSFLEDLNFDDICMISSNCYTVQHTEKTGELNEMVNDIGLKARKNLHWTAFLQGQLHWQKQYWRGRILQLHVS